MDPANGVVSQVYGANPEWAHQLGYGHLGRDEACPIGTPVKSIAPGVVVFADWGHKMNATQAAQFAQVYGNGNSGIPVFIQHDGWVSMSCHLSETAMNPGDRVVRGQIIGYSGNTGLSTGPHLHYEVFTMPVGNVPTWGRYNPQLQIDYEDRMAPAVATKDNERLIGPAQAFMRDKPDPSGKVVRTIPGVADHPAGGVEAFAGYYIGTEVTVGDVRSNIWYVDYGDSGKDKPRYVWAGMFTQQRTAGLKNLTPVAVVPETPAAAPLAPNQRRVGPNAAAVMRLAPVVDVKNTTGRIAPAGSVENFTHWARGQQVTVGKLTSDLWYHDSKEWAWAGSFDVQNTAGLTEWKPPAAAPALADKPYEFKADLSVVTQVLPAALGNFEYNNFPQDQTGAVIHQFNGAQPSEDPVTNKDTVHIGSVKSAFTGTGRVASAHFAFEGDEIVQFVSLKDRAYHAGEIGNERVGIEVYGGMDVKTLASVIRLLLALEGKYGRKLVLSDHNDYMNTRCGANVSLPTLEAMMSAARTPAPVQKPVPAPPVEITIPTIPAATKLLSSIAELTAQYDIKEK